MLQHALALLLIGVVALMVVFVVLLLLPNTTHRVAQRAACIARRMSKWAGDSLEFLGQSINLTNQIERLNMRQMGELLLRGPRHRALPQARPAPDPRVVIFGDKLRDADAAADAADRAAGAADRAARATTISLSPVMLLLIWSRRVVYIILTLIDIVFAYELLSSFTPSLFGGVASPPGASVHSPIIAATSASIATIVAFFATCAFPLLVLGEYVPGVPPYVREQPNLAPLGNAMKIATAISMLGFVGTLGVQVFVQGEATKLGLAPPGQQEPLLVINFFAITSIVSIVGAFLGAFILSKTLTDVLTVIVAGSATGMCFFLAQGAKVSAWTFEGMARFGRFLWGRNDSDT